MSSQVLKLLAAAMLIGSLVLIAVAFRLTQTPQQTGGTVSSAAPPPQEPALHKIVIASRLIRPGETIGETDITLSPTASPPPDAIENPADAIGKQPFMTIAAGSPLLRNHFPTSSFLRQSLREDERAIAIKVDELIGVGGLLRPGDRVDVMAYLRSDGQRVKENQVMIVLHSVRILAYGEELPGKPSQPGTTSSDDAAKATKGRGTAVLAIKTVDATRLTLAENVGVLRLALRPTVASEGDAANPYPITASQISAPPASFVSEDKPKGPRIEIYRGTRLEPVQFP